jgi:hypothetical protein
VAFESTSQRVQELCLILDYQETRSVSFDCPAGDGGWGMGSSPDPSICEYCQHQMVKILDPDRWGRISWCDDDSIDWWTVSICQSSRWWFQREKDNLETATIAYSEVISFAILRSFSADSAQVPLNILRDYLWKNKSRFHQLHPTKFEQSQEIYPTSRGAFRLAWLDLRVRV